MNTELDRQRQRRYFDAHHEECLARHREYQRAMHKKDQFEFRDSVRSRQGLMVLYDPRPVADGGFRVGSHFSNNELRYMLPAKDILLDGTVLQDVETKEEFVLVKGKMERRMNVLEFD